MTMANIAMRPDNVRSNDVFWLHWQERSEVVGWIERGPGGLWTVVPQGPHWSPMKSIGRSFDGPESALREVQLYFEHR